MIAVIFSLLALAAPDSLDRDYASELPRIAPTEAADALSTFQVHPDFELQLVASEPLLRDPIAMAFDADARCYVVEMTGYSEDRDSIPGTIRLLEDTNGDGVYDKGTRFLENLPWAVAVTCYDGGVFVGVPPDILYAKDTDGDNRADLVEKVYTGFAYTNVQGMMNTFLWGLDNRIHGATSSSGGHVQRANDSQSPVIEVGGRDFSFDPRSKDFLAESGGAQHGMSFDDAGRKFVCSNSDHLQWVWYEDRYTGGNPWYSASAPRISIAADGPAATVYRISPVEPWREVRTRLRVQGLVPGPVEGGGRAAGYFTSATGVTIYRGDVWPSEYRGQAFIGDVGGNLVHRKTIREDGLNLIGERADTDTEFIASKDTWFRPVQFANAPDGCLYIADMYREVIEHPDSLPPIIKKHLDLTSGNDRGRIYRIAPKGYRPQPLPKLSQLSTPELLPLLSHPNLWHRETASRLIFARQDQTVAPALAAMARDAPDALGRLHALYALDGLGALQPEQVVLALGDADPGVRRHALRLAESRVDSFDVRTRMLALAQDQDLWVQWQAAWSLAALPEEERVPALAIIVAAHPQDDHIRTAVITSAAAASGALAKMLSVDSSFIANGDAANWLESLAEVAGTSGRPGESAQVLAAVDALQADQPQLARGMLVGLAKHSAIAVSGNKSAAAMLAQVAEEASHTAADATAAPEARAEAVRVLQSAQQEKAQPVLLSLLSPQTPEEVQAAAVEALGRFDDEAIATALLGAWPSFSPARRAQATEVLFRRASSLHTLLNAVENGTFIPRDLDSLRIHALRNHSDAGIRERAAKLLPEAGSKREEIVAQYQTALSLSGDRERGRGVFEKNCTPCHKLHGLGNEVGPNLATVAQAGAVKILVNVLDPNRELNPQYVNYTITTNDFETHTGIIVAETAASITLKRAHGETDVVPRESIESIRSDALSIMPEGLEQGIDPQAMADLIAFITGG